MTALARCKSQSETPLRPILVTLVTIAILQPKSLISRPTLEAAARFCVRPASYRRYRHPLISAAHLPRHGTPEPPERSKGRLATAAGSVLLAMQGIALQKPDWHPV